MIAICIKCGNDFERLDWMVKNRSYKCLDCRNKYRRNWNKLNPEKPYSYNQNQKIVNGHKVKARRSTRTAVQNGTLIKKPCLVCGNINSETHHPDYLKPLEVIWLCKKHHYELHRECIT